MRLCPTSLVLLCLLVGIQVNRMDAAGPIEGQQKIAQDQPHWIWGTSNRRPHGGIRLSRSFSLATAIESATLHLAADFAECRLTINDTAVLKIDEYGPWLQHEVTEYLVPGNNRITLMCRSGEGPAAVAASLDIRLADGSHRRIISDTDWTSGVRAAVSFGNVAAEYWDVENIARISAFEDYEQWRRASGAEQGTDPATFSTRTGFEVNLVRVAEPDEGSWVSMAFDPQGRITIAKEDQGLLRMSLSRDGGRVTEVGLINNELKECRGLLYAHDALYANANNSKGLYRLRDTDGDDALDEVTLLREFPGSVGHGRNDLALGPDGMIYSIHGDAVELASDGIVDHTSPMRLARRGETTHEGHLIRTDRDGEHWELIASGLRNPFGIDFNDDGELFTYDADNEYDMGSPWYRPTRVDQLVSGADFGWRRMTNGEWPPYYPDHADNALPTVDVGKGSPTAVKSGRRSHFPNHYQRAIFALDWAYGRVLACHLSPRGAGYACRVESFLVGRPLNVTDLDFGPDGSMYIVTGGRKTKSALYRVRYVGEKSVTPSRTQQQIERDTFSSSARELRKRLAQTHGSPRRARDASTFAELWSHLAHPDPMIRSAARIGIEHVPVDAWRERALSEADPEIAATALLSLARDRNPKDATPLLGKLNELPVESLSALGRLSMLHAYRLVLQADDFSDSQRFQPTKQRLLAWLHQESDLPVAPLGSGYSVRQELARLVADLHVPGALPPLVKLLSVANNQRDRMNALYMLCHQGGTWTIDQRRQFFEALSDLERTAFSGAGMPGRLQQIRERAVAPLSDHERMALGSLVDPVSINEGFAKTISRPFVKKWTLNELLADVGAADLKGDPELGKQLFRDVLCYSCHRFGGRGGVVGPDLTSVASRFSRRDMLASLVNPSDVIAEKYRGTSVVTTDGRVISGQVIRGGDYRSSILKIATDPLDRNQVVEINKQEIESHKDSEVSPMPSGLLDTLTAEDVASLIAYLSQTNR